MVRICYTDEEAKTIIKDYWMHEFGVILCRDNHFDKISKIIIEKLNSKENLDVIKEMFKTAVGKSSEDYAKLNYKVIEKE